MRAACASASPSHACKHVIDRELDLELSFAIESLREIVALEQLHHHEGLTVVEHADVGHVDRRDRSSTAPTLSLP